MNKSILISVRPEYAVNILNGKKTLELRKSVPKDFVGWVYMYVTKGKPELFNNKLIGDGYVILEKKLGNLKYRLDFDNPLNAKVVARWWHDEFTQIRLDILRGLNDGYTLVGSGKEKDLCLSFKEIFDYLKPKKRGYAWHIKKLEIFDKPLELSEFYRRIDGLDEDGGFMLNSLKDGELVSIPQLKAKYLVSKAPQSWQYVWVKS
jgi:predicted transcriptional regulator